ncbi:MAG: hypothetical protein MMC33_007039 [Icmadophila ericetorum]|nr:hypothetical protein [Icmadophila ericetorum]
MFALLLPTRPVLTPSDSSTFTQISPTQYAFKFPLLPFFSHIVIFLLPGQLLPPEAAAAVYVQFPYSPEFKLLGAIGNEKQSAIFKVNAGAAGSVSRMSTGGMVGTPAEVDMDADDTFPPNMLNPPSSVNPGDLEAGGGEVTIGISIEPTASIAAQLATLRSSNPSISIQQPTPSTSTPSTDLALVRIPPSTKILAQRIIQNAFNFLASFSGGGGGRPDGEVVPLKAFRDWWVKFERRIESDPGFLERDGDG